MRTVSGDHERFEQTYFSRFDGYYFTGDGWFGAMSIYPLIPQAAVAMLMGISGSPAAQTMFSM